jgi:hypothetical protein
VEYATWILRWISSYVVEVRVDHFSDIITDAAAQTSGQIILYPRWVRSEEEVK